MSEGLFPLDSGLVWYIRGAELLSLLLALVLVSLAYRGYKKTATKSFLFAALGFGIIGIASLTEGILFDLVGLPLEDAHALRSTLTVLGLLVLLYSVHKTS